MAIHLHPLEILMTTPVLTHQGMGYINTDKLITGENGVHRGSGLLTACLHQRRKLMQHPTLLDTILVHVAKDYLFEP